MELHSCVEQGSQRGFAGWYQKDDAETAKRQATAASREQAPEEILCALLFSFLGVCVCRPCLLPLVLDDSVVITLF